MPTSLRAIAEKASTTGPVRKRTVLKSPVRENRTPGSVRGRSGNWPTYLDGGKATLMKYGAEIVDLTKVDFTPELLRCIPADVVRKYSVLPVLDSSDCLAIALSHVEDLNVIDS